MNCWYKSWDNGNINLPPTKEESEHSLCLMLGFLAYYAPTTLEKKRLHKLAGQIGISPEVRHFIEEQNSMKN